MRTTKYFLLSILMALLFTPASAQKTNEAQTAAIRAVLDAQAKAWNAGHLEEFMQGYWHSPNVTFYSGGGKQAGFDAVLMRYRKTYQSEGQEMGKLDFSDLMIESFDQNAAFVRGRYELTLPNGKKSTGLFTLIFRHFKKEGWKIIHDHTSANP